jgi:competence protein ComEC
MTKSKIFLILSLSFLGGVFFASFFDVDFLVHFLFLVAVIVFVLGYRNKIIIVSVFAILFFSFGIWKTQSALENISHIQAQEKVEFSGEVMVARETEEKEFYQEVVVRSENSDYKVLINAEKYENWKYGDKMELSCNLEKPENFSPDFDYRMYLAKDRIFYICKKPQLMKKTGENSGNIIFVGILRLKNLMEKNVNRVIPAPEAALADGLLFGGNNRLSKEWQEKFSRTGTSHIVAVSGYNVTIIAEYLIWLGILLGLWRPKAFWFALVGIFLFVAMIGFPSSAVRAGVMGSLLLWAVKNGRLANSYNAIIFSATVMLFLNPLLLRYDIGFALSFLAALGIIVTAPFWEKYFDKKFDALGILETILLTLSAQIFVLPIILYNFHMMSWLSVVVNALVLPIVPLTMLLVFLSSVLGFVFFPFSMVLGWAGYVLLRYETEVIDFFSGINRASWQTENFGWKMVAVYYFFLGGIFLIWKRYKNKSGKLYEK